MTEINENRTEQGFFANYPSGTCIMGAATESPCTYPAAEPLPRWVDEVPRLCAFHAAQEPLVDEVNELGVALEMLEAHLSDARDSGGETGKLVTALERTCADFSGRLEIAERVLEDLRAAEHTLMCG